MNRILIGGLTAVASLLLVGVSPAAAGNYAINFDAFASGVVVNGGGGGMTMPQNPVTFNAGADAFNAPNGLRRAGNCPNSPPNCTTGNHRLEIHFSAASPASKVSMRVGTVVPTGCFEFDCPTIQLAGYRANGTVAATTSRDYHGNSDLKALISIDAHAFSIRKAILVFSGDPISGNRGPGDSGDQNTAQLDDLKYTVDEGDPPPPPPPPGPSITIESPESGGPVFADTDVEISGRLDAPAGLSGFCIEANAPTGAIPEDCEGTGGVQVQSGSDAFSLRRIPGMRPGINLVRAFARDGLGRAASDSVSVTVADGAVDYITESIEITQGVQVDQLPIPQTTASFPGLGSFLIADYDGVPLSDAKTTVARVYSAARGGGGPVVGATAQLRGYRSDRRFEELSGSPLRPHFSPTLIGDPDLAVLRADPEGTFNFLLPSSWTHSGRDVTLVAETAPSSAGSGVPECCPGNNRFALGGIEFNDVRPVTTYTVALPFDAPGGGRQTLSEPHSDHLDMQRAVWPGRVNIISNLAPVDVTDVIAAERTGFDAVDGFIENINEAHGEREVAGKILGLNPTGQVCAGLGYTPTGATGCADRSQLLVAHESGHTYGLAHAMRNGACDGNALIGARADRQPLNGVGIDLRFWSGGSVGVFQLLAEEKEGVFDATPDASVDIYDYMSYCALGSTGWVSANYWATTVRELAAAGRIDVDYGGDCCFLGAASDPTVSRHNPGVGADEGEATTAAVGDVLHVGFTFRDYAPFDHEITLVERGSAQPFVPAVADPDQTVKVVVLDGGSGVISTTDVPLQVEGGASLEGEAEKPSAVVRIAVESAPGAQRVELRSSTNALLAAHDASPAAPTAKLKRPKPGTKIKSKGKFKASWKLSDADGDQLSSRLQFSPDGGKSWETLASSIDGGTVRVPGSELPRAGKKGRMRVVVSDGFNTATSQKKKISAQGSKPTATITAPSEKSLKLLSDTNLTLQGEAFDDRGKLLGGKKLIWSSGKRKLGKGESVDVPVYKLGRSIKLTATDSAKRKGKDTLKIKLKKVAPVLTLLEPGKLAKKSKKLKLRAAAAVPSKLKVSGKGLQAKRGKLGTKAKTLKLKTKGKLRKSYEVRLKLSASGKKSQTTVDVSRG